MKYFAFILLLSSQVIYAQNTFNKRMYFGQPFAILTSIFTTDSCYYATGVITDTTNITYKLGNIFVKFDLNGDTIFTKKLLNPGKYYQTWLGDLVQTHDGLLAEVGITADTILKAILIKFDLEGDTVFTKEYINPYYPNESFIATVAFANLQNDKFYLVCGINPDTIDVEGDLWVLKLDSTGNVLQDKIYGNSSTEIGGTILVEEDGSYIIGACKTNTNQVLKNFYRRSYIFKADNIGNILWEYQSPTNVIQDIATGIKKSPDGGLVVATSRGYEYQVNPETGQLRWESAYFFKLDENQNVVWDLEVFDTIRPSPGNSLEKLISVDSGEAYVAAGHYNMIRSLDPPIGGTFGWFFKFSDEGELIWLRKHQFIEVVGHRHEVYDLKQTPDGGFIIVGKAQGTINNIEPASQAWLLKIDSFGCLIPGCQVNDTVSVTSTEPEQARVELAIYPNPTSDYLNFQLRSPLHLGPVNIRILNATGLVVKEFRNNNPKDTVIVPVWDWPQGVYFLQYLEEGLVRASKKFVKH